MGQIAGALDYAHAEQVLHRDLKPGNVLLDTNETMYLTDFGFAKILGQSSYSMTISGGIVGSPHYMAPEAWEERSPGIPADIYAMGCILYEMVTGEKLFQGDSIPGIMRAHFKGLELPSSWPQGVPEELGLILRKALSHQPNSRYRSAGDLVRALSRSHEIKEPVIKRQEPVPAEISRLPDPIEPPVPPDPEPTKPVYPTYPVPSQTVIAPTLWNWQGHQIGFLAHLSPRRFYLTTEFLLTVDHTEIARKTILYVNQTIRGSFNHQDSVRQIEVKTKNIIFSNNKLKAELRIDGQTIGEERISIENQMKGCLAGIVFLILITLACTLLSQAFSNGF